jgi:TonB family protein
MSPEITAPRIAQAAPAVYPQGDAPANAIEGTCMLSMVVGSDGIPVNIHVIHSAGEAFDAAAIEAVKASKFEPGILNKQPVPVRVRVRVLFSSDRSPAIPTLLLQKYRNPGSRQDCDQPPVPIHWGEADFSDEARRNRVSGVVSISLMVGTDGLPSDLRVERSVGYGLDEKALEAVKQYRFRPAMKDGKPVAVRLTVQVSFKFARGQ